MPVDGCTKNPREPTQNTLTLLESGKINYVISTSCKGRIPTRDSVKIRRKAVERSIPCLTSMDTANATGRQPEEPVYRGMHRAWSTSTT